MLERCSSSMTTFEEDKLQEIVDQLKLIQFTLSFLAGVLLVGLFI
jgi:hypothetical protein